ncbi:MAG: hypothetical protein ACXVBG_19890, partial [Isosphaeraceae bacterium]
KLDRARRVPLPYSALILVASPFLLPRFYSLFFPLLLDLELPQAVAHAGLPGSEQIPPLRSRPFGGGYHGRGRCHILGSRGVGRDVAH